MLRAAFLLCATAAVARAQAQLLPSPGSIAEERARLREITGAADTARVARRLVDWLPPLKHVRGLERSGLFVLEPDLRIIHNSNIPFSLNDGALWAGRGWNASLSGGFGRELRVGGATARVALAPMAVFSENLPFPMFPAVTPGRSSFSSPQHSPGNSLDLPQRFGDLYLLRIDPGRSGISVTANRLTAAITAENEVWGPGIRNQLIMSAHAAGIPRLSFATARPFRPRIGRLDAKLIAGTLTETVFFDSAGNNNFRSLSGVLLELRPAFDSMLTIGLARVVYAPIESPINGPLAHALDVLTLWQPIAPFTDTLPDGRLRQRADQIISLTARWIFPASGLEMYLEWAHMDLPRTATELLVAGHHSAGYTVGFQWAPPRRSRDVLRLQTEITYLEQSRVFQNRPLPDFYAGHASGQGYTNRGQVVGAAIGPGGSSQWIALDYLAPRWQSGLFVGRIRWENDALYRLGGVANFFRHDVTILGGLRGGMRTPLTDLRADATFGYRFNYLFQYGGANPGGFRTVDIRNFTLTFAATPR